MNADARPYFFFGTLMDHEVLGIVLGRDPTPLRIEPARLGGFRRLRVKGESYPTLEATAGGHVDGRLVWGLEATDIARIAFYEGEEYYQSHIEVRCADGATQVALTFATEPNMATAGDWDFEHWRSMDRPHIVAAAQAFMRHFGSVSDTSVSDRRWREARAEARRLLKV